MRSSNTSHDGRLASHWPPKWLPAVLAAACSIGAAYAIDPNRAMSQYVHDKWGPENGLPSGPIYAITQTADGYLWIGSETGLFRFDGFNFRLMEDHRQGSPMRQVLGLIPDEDGSLWVRLPWTVLHYRHGEFESVESEVEGADSVVTAMSREYDGTLLLSSLGAGTVAYRGGRFRTLATTPDLSRAPVISIAGTRDGRVWIGTRDAGLFHLTRGRVSAITEGLPDLKINCLLPFGEKELWAGTDNGIVHWNGTELTKAGIPASLEHVQALALADDRDSNLWIGTASQGLVRLNARGAASLEKPNQGSAQAVTAVFEDRERNLWYGSASSLERLRDSVFVTYSVAEGLSNESNGPLYVDWQGRTWFAPIDGGLYWLKEGRIQGVTQDGLGKDVVYSIAGGKDELWIGRQRGGLTRLRPKDDGFTAKTFTRAEGLAQNSVYAVQQSRDGTVWAGTLSGGVSHYENGKFTTYTTANGLPSNTVAAIAEGSDGTMWFGTPGGLGAFSKGRWRFYGVEDGSSSPEIDCMMEDTAGVLWIGTANGLFYLRNGRVQIPKRLPAPLHEPIEGIAEDRNGSLWIATSNHVVQVSRDQLMQGTGAADVREYGLADGLRGTEGVRRQRSVAADSLGRIWFSLNRGISVVDPAHIPSSAPVIAHIQTISADGAPVDVRGPIRVPPNRRRITFGYVGLSLSVPERVRFRYRLEGFDHSWSEPVSTREAVYTNLGPGPYRFRVQANNGDGLWNGVEASLPLELDPAFRQTWWFLLLCVAAFLILALAVFRIRMRQIRHQLNVRFEERLAERTRIARELHDNLLQNVTGLALQIGGVSKIVTAPDSAKKQLQELRRQAEDCLREARQYVWDIRSTESESIDLAAALRESGEQLTSGKTTRFISRVEGESKPLTGDVRQQLLRIGREAIGNAVHHAQATQIEARLSFEADSICLRISDDGCGFNLDDAANLPGHFGLATMRERASQIRGSLRVCTKMGQGTCIEVTVPTRS